MLKMTWKECHTCQWTTDCLEREREGEEQVPPVLVIRERSHKIKWATLVPRKGTEFPWIAKRAAKFIDQLGHNKVDPQMRQRTGDRSTGEGNRTGSPRGKPNCSRERPPVGESQSNGIIEAVTPILEFGEPGPVLCQPIQQEDRIVGTTIHTRRKCLFAC